MEKEEDFYRLEDGQGNGGAAFPTKAPTAPPLPEECEEDGGQAINMVEATPLPLQGQGFDEGAPEFMWLFEYGLEMDSAVLNAPEKLDGAALYYGPAVLKGYRVALDAIETAEGKPLPTLLPDGGRDTTVWGVLYRVPTRLTKRGEGGVSQLDAVHFAAPPAPLFSSRTVVVHESYRGRAVACTTYMATPAALEQFHRRQGEHIDTAFAQRLLEIARQRALPDEYVQRLCSQAEKLAGEPPAAPAQATTSEKPVAPAPGQEQDTEPLQVLADRDKAPAETETDMVAGQPHGGMMAFAVYLATLLLLVLALAVLQGMGLADAVFTASFTPLGIPWFILVYGLLGGCVSSIISLGRRGLAAPPPFVLITWFTRPFIGALLAMLAYLLLNSGLLALNGSASQHAALFSLLAGLAGLAEGWLFRPGRR